MSYRNLTFAMDTTKLSAKGQVVLPKRVRDELGWKAGTEFVVERAGAGVTLTPKAASRQGSIRDLRGVVKHQGRPVTLQQMDEAVSKEIRRRRESGRY